MSPPGFERLVEIHEGVSIFPTRPLGGMQFAGGAVGSAGAPIELSLLFRGGAAVVHVDRRAVAATAEHDDEVVFGGQLFPHFGHFTLETLARIWYARQRPELPIVFAPRVDRPSLEEWQTELFTRFGILDRTRLLVAPSRFPKVHFPQPAFEIRNYSSDEYIDSMRIVAGRREPSERVWLSRRGVDEPRGHGNLNARDIERELASRGWQILRPEQHRIDRQLEYLANARRIAGDEGAAFHLLVYVDFRIDPRVDIFTRKAEVHQNYALLAKHISGDHRFHSVRGKRIHWSARNRVRFSVPDPEAYLRHLEEE
jgi:capsular polysaccharide biosynthesis protein